MTGLPRKMRLADGRPCVLRLAREDDLPRLRACTDIVAREGIYIASEGEQDPARFRRRFWEPIEAGEHVCIVAEVAGNVAGYIDIQPGRLPKRRHTAYISELLVSELRGLGIGTALMAEAVGLAGAKNIRKIFLSVFSTNTRAVEFYRKNGFEVEGVLRGQFVIRGEPVDELYMARWL